MGEVPLYTLCSKLWRAMASKLNSTRLLPSEPSREYCFPHLQAAYVHRFSPLGPLVRFRTQWFKGPPEIICTRLNPHPRSGSLQRFSGSGSSDPLIKGGKAGLLIRKHDHYTPTRGIERHVRAITHNHPEGWKLQGHVSPVYDGLITEFIKDAQGGNVHGALVLCIKPTSSPPIPQTSMV